MGSGMKNCSELDVYTRLPLAVRGAHGTELVLADGTRVLDLYGGHCVNTLGAGNEALLAAFVEQWGELSFATNLFSHEARSSFLRAFERLLPAGSWRVFLSNSGAEANENAIKAALNATGRERVVVFEGAFHGRTAAAAAASDTLQPGFPHAPFEVLRVPFNDIEAAQAAIDERVGLVLLEPIQSLAGVVEATPAFLQALRTACDEVGAQLAFDEVQTGNGRLGTPWAAQSFGVLPDLFTTAKGAAGGLPIGITTLSNELAQRLPSGLFGSTFGGGPSVLACATEVAVQLAGTELLANVQATSEALRSGLAGCGGVRAVRGRGLLLGLELDGLTAKELRDRLLAQGILVGTSNDPYVARLSPPLTLAPAEAARLVHAFDALEVPS